MKLFCANLGQKMTSNNGEHFTICPYFRNMDIYQSVADIISIDTHINRRIKYLYTILAREKHATSILPY